MKKTHILLLFLAVLAVAGCEKVLEIDPDPSKTGLVLNAVPSAGKPAFIYFANTRFFLDTSNNQPIPGATLSLYVNGIPQTLDSIVRCRYYFSYLGNPGDTLEVRGTSPSGNVYAKTYIPLVPTISNISLLRDTGGYSLRYYNVDFNFQDHLGIDEYYNLYVSVRDSGARFNEWKQKLDTVDTVHSTYFALRYNPEIADQASYVNPLMGLLFTRNLFNDSDIDGRNYPVRMQILHLVDTTEVQPFKHEYTVTLESMTFARLRYLIDVSRQGSSSSFFSEQGQVRGNVDGAYGIFAGNAVSKFTFWPDTLSTLP